MNLFFYYLLLFLSSDQPDIEPYGGDLLFLLSFLLLLSFSSLLIMRRGLINDTISGSFHHRMNGLACHHHKMLSISPVWSRDPADYRDVSRGRRFVKLTSMGSQTKRKLLWDE